MFARKPIAHSHRDTGLHRALGPVALTALVAGRRVRPDPGVSCFTGGGA